MLAGDDWGVSGGSREVSRIGDLRSPVCFRQRSWQERRLRVGRRGDSELTGEESQSWQERRLRVGRRGDSELAGEETQSRQERRLRVGRSGDSKETCVERDS